MSERTSDASEAPDPDVIVVGAGLAGLIAARELARAGARVLVFEARERVGGRVMGAALEGGGRIEAGGQWVGPGQGRIAGLIGELGLRTFPTPDQGRHLLELDGKLTRYRGTVPRVGPLSLIDIALIQRKINRLAKTIDPARPWASPDATDLDRLSLAAWLGANARTRKARKLIRIAGRTIWGAEPEEISLLHALFYIRAAGRFEALIDTEGGAQQDRVIGGSHRIVEALADELAGRLQLAAPVEGIAHHDDGVEVRLASGERHRARRVVVAVPTPLRSSIDFDPPLPEPYTEVAALARFGRTAKCMAVYERPFWNARGLSGIALSDIGPLTLIFDNSMPGDGRGILLGFIGGSDTSRWRELGADDRRRRVLECLVRMFGSEAASPIDYVEQDWGAEPWTTGGPTFVMAPGAWSRIGPCLASPVGRVHWAGTETATEWPGYMEGAVRSGERVAAEVLATLRPLTR